MLPPLTAATQRITVSAVLEPCYDVGGDGFDYAIDGDGDHAFLAVFDAVGHSLKAGLACTTVIAAVRSARRCGHDLVTQGRTADAALTDQFTDARFVTAFLADLDLETGLLRYVNAGHPRPLLLRGGKMVRELRAGRRLPLGIPATAARVGEEILEPGDQLLLFTDGVPEAGVRAGDRSVCLAWSTSPNGRPRLGCRPPRRYGDWPAPPPSTGAAHPTTTPLCCWPSGPAPPPSASCPPRCDTSAVGHPTPRRSAPPGGTALLWWADGEWFPAGGGTHR
ncbi:PP2C family protein-serine/threonine phosphatase [Micromonospora sp. LOL_015]|uniref:PP2C family protein-serine/threonine phosphatase n=1 Tax=Micromonospora sp. LOL_015 TaxID=3345416 RepID=UPI003A862D20